MNRMSYNKTDVQVNQNDLDENSMSISNYACLHGVKFAKMYCYTCI